MKPAGVNYFLFSVLTFIGSSASSEPIPDATLNPSLPIKIPDGLLLGAGTSAPQVEGATNTNGKSESYVLSVLHKIFPNISAKVSAEVASDSYHLYKEDVKVLEYTKLNIYRLSLSWPRLLPTGYANAVNKDGVRYYHALLDELERIGVEPLVLLHHFDHPTVLEKSDIWETGKIVELFTNYARFVFQEFGSRVKNFVTFNEPNQFCHKLVSKIYGNNQNDESKRMARAYACGHNILKAHAQVYHMYHNEFNPNRKGKLSVNTKCENFFAKNKSDEISAEVAFQFQCGWLAHPIYSKSGDYHRILKQWVQENSFAENLTVSRLPVFSQEWIQKIKGSADYFGLSHYSTYLVETAPRDDPESWNNQNLRPGVISDARLLTSQPPCDTAASGLCVAPEGFRNILQKIKSEYNNPVVYVLENGYSDDGRLNDSKRIQFMYSYIKEAINAIKYDNIDIKVYIYWSLIDSFEYDRGYNSIRFGLAHVDFGNENRTRTLRKSANWLRKVMETGKLHIE